MPLSPHLKFIISGAVLIGGAVLILSTMPIDISVGHSDLGESLPSGFESFTNSFRIAWGIDPVFLVIGIISICVGLPLLIVGMVKRSRSKSATDD
ncbi:MAG: hypothetical protein RBG13Loki_1370 [Promethearchaeota archaeon CR_4]|nr:MAG: hypothetical protein RBG13Loki_1370 [Candidatus Lokiarchaeota archaeon CR_4]